MGADGGLSICLGVAADGLGGIMKGGVEGVEDTGGVVGEVREGEGLLEALSATG